MTSFALALVWAPAGRAEEATALIWKGAKSEASAQEGKDVSFSWKGGPSTAGEGRVQLFVEALSMAVLVGNATQRLSAVTNADGAPLGPVRNNNNYTWRVPQGLSSTLALVVRDGGPFSAGSLAEWGEASPPGDRRNRYCSNPLGTPSARWVRRI